jgi:hypothetical protein
VGLGGADEAEGGFVGRTAAGGGGAGHAGRRSVTRSEGRHRREPPADPVRSGGTTI